MSLDEENLESLRGEVREWLGVHIPPAWREHQRGDRLDTFLASQREWRGLGLCGTSLAARMGERRVYHERRVYQIMNKVESSREIPINVPRSGLAGKEVTFIEWCVADGKLVKEGEMICVLETDKAQIEIEAPDSGTLRQRANAGEVFEIGASLGAIVTE
jgi:hypothetical protein